MSDEAKHWLEDFQASMAKTTKLAPDAVRGFGGLFQKVMGDGAISVREKELIALAIGVALRCEPCIRLHVKKCLEVGSTKEQIIEAAQVAVMMGGGPCYTHLPMVVETLEALEA
jgi:AhpD family alkylhydroperoxidase